MLRFLMLALASALSTAAGGQMFKCIGADGKATYRDSPCDARARQTDVEGQMTGRLPGIRYYEIYSKDWTGMRREIDEKGPRGYHGLAAWRVFYNYRYGRSANGLCSITEVVPRFEGEILMPHWAPGPDVTATQRQQWDRYLAALRVHENGHIEHGTQLAAAIARLSGIQSPSCGEAESRLRKLADGLIKHHIEMDVVYDRDTNHGATQGALLQR